MKTNEYTQNENIKEYTIKIKKKKFRWWLLLLLLLPLLLLIKCEKNIVFKVVDSQKQVVEGAIVKLKYTEHYITKDTPFDLEQKSDSLGLVIFPTFPYSIYSYFFHSNESLIVTAENHCYQSDSLNKKFHDIPNNAEVELILKDKNTKIDFLIVDAENNQPIPEADLKAYFDKNGKNKELKAKSKVSGEVFLSEVPYCSSAFVVASYHGYENDTIKNTTQKILSGKQKEVRILRLKPIKKMMQFFVKDLYSKKAIANAKANLIIGGKTVQTVKTNVNGYAGLPGEGKFKEIRITADFTIEASKNFYNDTTYSDKVETFIQKTAEQRTIYLRPKKGSLVFRNVESGSSKPISGAKNQIYVNGKLIATEYSNSSGEFTLSNILPDDKISIIASKSGYNKNQSKIKNRKYTELKKLNPKGRDIPLSKIPPPPPPTPPAEKSNEFEGEAGDLRMNLQWNTIDDLDILVTDPCGNTIWALELSHTCRGGTGRLDIDANTNRYPPSTYKTNPQENIYWKNPTKGNYTVKVEYCNHQSKKHHGDVKYNLTIIYKGKRSDYSGKVREKQKKLITVYKVD